jgi:hypothetical protein
MGKILGAAPPAQFKTNSDSIWIVHVTATPDYCIRTNSMSSPIFVPEPARPLWVNGVEKVGFTSAIKFA